MDHVCKILSTCILLLSALSNKFILVIVSFPDNVMSPLSLVFFADPSDCFLENVGQIDIKSGFELLLKPTCNNQCTLILNSARYTYCSKQYYF